MCPCVRVCLTVSVSASPQVNQATQDTLLHQAALNDLEEEAVFLVKAKAKTGTFNRQVRLGLWAIGTGPGNLTCHLLRSLIHIFIGTTNQTNNRHNQ